LERLWKPSQPQQNKFNDLDKKLRAAKEKLYAAQLKLQEKQKQVQSLTDQQRELQQAADRAQHQFADQQVQAAADTLLEVAYAVDGLVQHIADAVASVHQAAAQGPFRGSPAASLSSGPDLQNYLLRKHLQVAEDVTAAAQSQALQAQSAQNVLFDVKMLQASGCDAAW
jgi:DNA repair exonuclease SbcCD ATPase subunit